METDSTEATVPEISADDLALVQPAAATPAERIQQIEAIRDENIEEYFAEGMDREWLKLRKEADANGEASEGEGEDDNEGEDVVGDGDLSHEDLALLDDSDTADAGERTELEGYELPALEGYEWTEAEQAGAKPFLAKFGELGLDQDAAEGLLATYAERVGEVRAQLDAQDAASSKAARAALTETWGGQEAFNANKETIKSFLDNEVPADVSEMIANARASNGARLLNQPAFVDLLLQVARGQTSDTASSPNVGMSELAQINELMHTDIDAYNNRPWKGTDQTAADRRFQLMRQSKGKR